MFDGLTRETSGCTAWKFAVLIRGANLEKSLLMAMPFKANSFPF